MPKHYLSMPRYFAVTTAPDSGLNYIRPNSRIVLKVWAAEMYILEALT